jgi:hypothetical protein
LIFAGFEPVAIVVALERTEEPDCVRGETGAHGAIKSRKKGKGKREKERKKMAPKARRPRRPTLQLEAGSWKLEAGNWKLTVRT